MKIAMRLRMLAVLLSMLAAVNVAAQETPEAESPEPPDLLSLSSDWWIYFDGPRGDIEPRIELFLETTNQQIANLGPQNQEVATSVLEAVRDNFEALLGLRSEAEFAAPELPPEDFGYSIEDLLEFAALAREAGSAAAEEQIEVSREQRVLAGATRRRDSAFKAYLEAQAGDERWLTALQLVQARSAQAISARRLELLVDRLARGTAFARETAALVELATERLAATADEDDIERLLTQV